VEGFRRSAGLELDGAQKKTEDAKGEGSKRIAVLGVNVGEKEEFKQKQLLLA